MVQLENESKPFAKLKIFIKLAASLSLTANPNWTVWNNSKCDTIVGTDGTIFPPMLKKEEGLASFAPDLCRSLIAQFDKHDKYDGIPILLTSGNISIVINDTSKAKVCQNSIQISGRKSVQILNKSKLSDHLKDAWVHLSHVSKYPKKYIE
ncbi:hypothetical protein HUJ04_011003 [Dendroctonus ponderosae]|nr:hypothetical protein HUJ04_011003 [Dendroctonus ponderosae]